MTLCFRALVLAGLHLTVYQCIRLPGIEDPSAAPQEPDLPPYLPISVQSEAAFNMPSNRGIFTNLVSLTQGNSGITTPPSSQTRNMNPLVTLLDKLFGNREWTTLLSKLDDTATAPEPSTRSPAPTESTSATYEQPGFYNFQVSGGNLVVHPRGDSLQDTNETDTIQTNFNPGLGENAHLLSEILLRLKNVYKIPGQHVAQDAHSHGNHPNPPSVLALRVSSPAYIVTPKPSIDNSPWSNSGENAMYQQINQHMDTPVPAPTVQPFEQTNNGAFFNANQINQVQNTYNPNQVAAAYQPQTGSNPYNANLRTSFNADETNQRYLQEVYNSPPGVGATGQQTVVGKGTIGYQFSAYESSQPVLFDASALNRALFDSQNMFSGNNQPIPNQSFRPGVSGLNSPNANPTEKSPHSVEASQVGHHNGPKKNAAGVHDDTTTPISTLSSHTPIPVNAQFNFIPGNLFPGQSTSTGLTAAANRNSQIPSYLRNAGASSIVQSFNPNTLNQAQRLFNPNAASWIKSRSVREYNPFTALADEGPSDTTNTTSITPHMSGSKLPHPSTSTVVRTTTTTAPMHTKYTPSAAKVTETVASAMEFGTTMKPNTGNINTDYAGFDPNTINSEQGQTSFVPGQMGPLMGGQMQIANPFSYGEAQPNGQAVTGMDMLKQTHHEPNNYGSASMNFDISNLLGMSGTGQRANNSEITYGLGGTGFDPSVWNNVQEKVFSGAQNSTGINGFGMSVPGSGFDPNAANVGFGNVLGIGSSGQTSGIAGFGFISGQISNSSNGSTFNSAYGFSTGGFDPNAANVGFGSTDYGFGGSSGGGGFDMSNFMGNFNPDAVNQVAIQNPFEGNVNSNSSKGDSSSLMNYFLGITSSQSGNGNHGKYESAFISSFNPNSVNQATYDPDKFNTMHLHFDPVEMLSKNPGMGGHSPQNSNFNADKVNSVVTQIAFSPIDMIITNPGMDRDVLAKVGYDPSKAPAQGQTGASSGLSGQDLYTDQGNAAYDPFDLMQKMMQSSSGFQPGTAGSQHINFSPLSMFSNGDSDNTAQSSHGKSKPSPSSTTSTKPVTHTTSATTSSNSPSALTTTATTTTAASTTTISPSPPPPTTPGLSKPLVTTSATTTADRTIIG